MILFRKSVLVVLSVALIVGNLVVQANEAPALNAHDDALFATDEILKLTLSAPLKRLHNDRDKSASYPASLGFKTLAGEAIVLDIRVQVRGNYRLKRDVCLYPPLRIVFDKAASAGTLFEHQTKLKLVTQCDPIVRYERYMLNEYLAYRIFNLITPKSFRVRLVRVAYQDTQRAGKSRRAFGFFIEHKKRLAKRLGLKTLAIEQTSAVDLDSVHLNQGSLFQLLIGNVDWSATSGGTDECCHNYKLFASTGERLFSIPYDFDLTGLVNAKYAQPDKEMGLRSIRDRRYRGYCRNNEFLEQNIQLFNDKKAAILDLFESFPHLSDAGKKSSKRYVESFYKIINNPKRVKRVILTRCHKSTFVLRA